MTTHAPAADPAPAVFVAKVDSLAGNRSASHHPALPSCLNSRRRSALCKLIFDAAVEVCQEWSLSNQSDAGREICQNHIKECALFLHSHGLYQEAVALNWESRTETVEERAHGALMCELNILHTAGRRVVI